MTIKHHSPAQRLSQRPERVLVLGFMLLIALGTGLLALPAAARDGRSIGFFDSLFTAASAVCVTGLVAVDTGAVFSLFGQIVLLLLIQVGGLGFMVFATLIMSMLGHRISLREKLLIRESMNASSQTGLTRLVRANVLLALGIEGLGAALLSIRLIPAYGPARGLWYAVFHAVSAFCNAGFDLFGRFSSLTGFAADPLTLLAVSLLIILGGLGFPVMLEMLRGRGGIRGMSLHARMVLLSTAVLLMMGTAFYAAVEWNNPAALAAGNAGAGQRLLGAFFQSVTMRTAGFNSVDLSALSDGSKLFSCLLMLIGASPASTGGGIKTTTVAAVVLLVASVVKGESDINLSGRRLAAGIALRALAVTALSLAMLFTGTLLLTLFEGGRYSLADLLFEASSAVATVGVSAIGSPNLTLGSRIVLIPLMFLGRVGPLTLATALAKRPDSARALVKYPEENLMIG